MSFRHAMTGSASIITGEWHAVVMSVLYLGAIALCLGMRQRMERLFTEGNGAWAMGLLGALGLAGHSLLVGSPFMGSSTPLVTIAVVVGFLLTVAFIVGHILAWGDALRRLPLAEALLVVVSSNALSYGVQLACDALSSTFLLGYLFVCPLGSAAFWIAAARKLLPCSETPAPGIAHSLAGLPWKLMAPSIVLIYFEQLFSSLLFKRYVLWPRDNLTVTLAVSCVLWVIASVYLARWALAHPKNQEAVRTSSTVLTTIFAVLLVVYMGALLATLMFPEGDGLIVERFLVAAGSSFRVLLWLAITAAVHAQRSSLVVGYLTYVFFVLALPVSRLMSLVLDRIPAATIDALTSPTAIVAAAGIVLFLIAAVFVMGSVRNKPTTGPADDQARAAERELASTAGLSPRETEVLELVCRGFTAKRAGERLGISESTVVSHMTHIYRKLGVNSKQELVALVEERGRG